MMASGSLRLFLAHGAGEAYVVNTGSPTDQSQQIGQKRGRSAQPMRHDTQDDALPIVEWDASLVGQRARVLIDEHEWAEAIIAAHGASGHTLVLTDGRSVQCTLPDHRVALQIEAARDASDGAPAAEAPTCPQGHRLLESDAGEGVVCDGCGSAISADASKAFVCHTCDYDLCEACGVSAAKKAQPYFSSLSLTGYRHVRATVQVGALGADRGSFEALVYIDGRERSLGVCPSAPEAAERYRAFAAEHMPCCAPPGSFEAGGGEAGSSGAATSKKAGGSGSSSEAKKSGGAPSKVQEPGARTQGLRQTRCGTCAGCILADCGQCKMCLDKPKFGGLRTKKRPRVKRRPP